MYGRKKNSGRPLKPHPWLRPAMLQKKLHAYRTIYQTIKNYTGKKTLFICFINSFYSIFAYSNTVFLIYCICILSKIFHISEAASIAIHSMAMISRSNTLLNTKQVAAKTGFSKNHTAKILQQLAKNGFLRSTRGPRGGFVLGKKAEEISLMDIYRIIEGQPEETVCRMDCGNCPVDTCIFGGLDARFSGEFKQYMTEKNLAML